MGRHIAFKCIYNDSGEADLVGFHGTCSPDNIKRNIEGGRVWCSQPNCGCRQYYDRGFKGDPPTDPCYESRLFRDWKFGAGRYHHGPKKGTPKRIRHVKAGCVAILTTRFRGDDEEIERRIIGLFRISKVYSDPRTIVVADQQYRVRLPLQAARQLYFWDYYQNPNSPETIAWGTHLFRYLTDAQTARIIKSVREAVQDGRTRSLLDSLLQEVWGSGDVLPASGPRTKTHHRRI